MNLCFECVKEERWSLLWWTQRATNLNVKDILYSLWGPKVTCILTLHVSFPPLTHYIQPAASRSYFVLLLIRKTTLAFSDTELTSDLCWDINSFFLIPAKTNLYFSFKIKNDYLTLLCNFSLFSVNKKVALTLETTKRMVGMSHMPSLF